MTTNVFALSDPLTGDGLAVDLDGGRLVVRVDADGRSATVVIVEPGASRRLAEGLAAALEAATSREES